MRASASAASVPGSGAMCSSAWAAVRVRTGSITTRWAPALRASSTNFQKWWWLESGLEPQSRISFACANPSGSIVAFVPSVRRSPTVPATEQIVIRWSLAPRTFHRRAPERPSSPWR